MTERKRLPKGYWTFERCLEVARQYPTRTAFASGDGAAYCAAKKAGWLSEIYKLTEPNGVGHNYWTEGRLIEEARKYKTVREFRAGSPSAYTTAVQRGLSTVVMGHLERSGGNRQRLVYLIFSRSERKVYVGLTFDLRRRMDHHRKQGEPYVREILSGPHKVVHSKPLPKMEAAARERGLIETLRKRGYDVVNRASGGGLGGGTKRWTEELLMETAAPYSSRVDFRWGNQAAYAATVKMGLLDKVCAHMKRPPSEKLIWTPEALRNVAKNYSSRMAFRNAHLGAYSAAHHLGLLDEIFAHAPNPHTPLTIEEMCELARSRGGECLSPAYKNLSEPLLWRCQKGHEWSANARNAKHAGQWCPVCAKSKMGRKGIPRPRRSSR